MSKSWYAFLGGDTPMNPELYFKITVNFNCLCGNEVCAIYASGDGMHPNAPLSNNITQYINNALVTGQLQPEYPIGAKKYLYLRDRD